MSTNYLIGDVFTIIRNATMAKKDSVDVPASNFVQRVLEILKKENYIENYKRIEDKKQGLIRISLKSVAGKPAIRNIKCISKPGLRVYVRREDIPQVLRGRGIAIVSTSKGIVTDKEARELGVGGEVVAYIW